ncbi:MAG: GNAT family acetyltransferase [Pseudolysinimonas sp.]
MSIEIRVFEPAQADAVITLWTECGLLRPWNDPRRDIRRKTAVQPELFLVAYDGDELVGAGMAGYDGHRGTINYLAVSQHHRSAGIGRQLMAEFETRLEALGCPKVNLQVRGDNADVLAFYRRLGYQVDDVVSLGKRIISDE